MSVLLFVWIFTSVYIYVYESMHGATFAYNFVSISVAIYVSVINFEAVCVSVSVPIKCITQ